MLYERLEEAAIPISALSFLDVRVASNLKKSMFDSDAEASGVAYLLY